MKLFSQRQKEEQDGMPDVYIYDSVPEALRNQVILILDKLFNSDIAKVLYFDTIEELKMEHGVLPFPGEDYQPRRYKENLTKYFRKPLNPDKVLDVIEALFLTATNIYKKCNRNSTEIFHEISLSEAIDQLNYRFKQHDLGYQFESGKIIRIDSQFTHHEIIKPALHLLQQPTYEVANQEFLTAHEHYRHSRHSECIVAAAKSMESVLKIICTNKQWEYKESDSMKNLLDIVFKNNLIPDFMKTQFNELRNLLEKGTPMVRNKLAAHGAGPNPVKNHAYWARYALNTAASNIVLLIDAAEAKNY